MAFGDEHAVADARLALPATLAQHAGLRELVDELVDLGDAPGHANVGHKAMTLIHAMLGGANSIDDAGGLLGTPGKRGKPLSKYTVHHSVRGVRRFLGWCRTEGEEAKGTPQLPRLSQWVVDVLSREQIDRLENAAPTERDKLIIRILADTGIGAGEDAA